MLLRPTSKGSIIRVGFLLQLLLAMPLLLLFGALPSVPATAATFAAATVAPAFPARHGALARHPAAGCFAQAGDKVSPSIRQHLVYSCSSFGSIQNVTNIERAHLSIR